MSKTMKKILLPLIAVVALVSIATGCENDDQSKARKDDEKVSADSLRRMQDSQPAGVYDWSQYRETLNSVNDAKANTTQTTSFFFLEGVGLVSSCPSIGFPLPSTAQITNPEQKEDGVTLPQVEPTGVYTGESTGTYTLCVDSDGRPYADYWEGYVKTVTGPAKWDGEKVVLTGKPTGDFTKGE